MKHKLVKKMITAVLAAVMLIPSSYTGMETTWAELGITDDGFHYEVDDGSITIQAYTGEKTELEIPGSIDGIPVTDIAASAFFGKTTLTSVMIPEGVASIGYQAFHSCSSLTSVSIPEGVTTIGGGAFGDCGSLKDITLPESLKQMGDSFAFENCSSLTSIIIPKNVKTIYDGTFRGCSSLTEVTIPLNVGTINSYAFDKCDKLTDVYYAGAEGQWNGIRILGGNAPLTSARIHYNSSGSSGTGGSGETGGTGGTGGSSGMGGTGGSSGIKLQDISKIASVTCKTTSLVFDGKVKTPDVTVYVGTKILAQNKDYTVSYKDNKNVGTASIVVKGTGNYTGEIVKTFTIVPKGTGISGKVKGKKKALAVKWKKTKAIDGYEIWCSTGKSFSKKTTVKKTAKKTAAKLTVRKLKTKKTYYVKIRTYKSVNGKKYYSFWSTVKTARTK